MGVFEAAQAAFLQKVRQQLKLPELSFEEAIQHPLAQTLFDMLERNLEPATDAPSAPAPEMPPSLATFSHSRAVIQSAIHDTFELQELQPGDAERDALTAAAGVVVVGGKRRLRLSDTARAEVLAATTNTDLYRTVLNEAIETDRREFTAIGNDPVRLPSAWLHGFLANEFGNLDKTPPKEAAAALAARERLRLVADLPSGVPPIADLERRVALAQLLDPLRLLIGAEGGWDDSPARDRFVGRQPELTNLRAFVDELSSQSIHESLKRWSAAAATALGFSEKPNLRVVQADGGLGKSALLSKFLLDHARDQKRPFPFAYLDFDRAALDAGQPTQLLIEIARQVGLQFPKAQPEFNSLSEEIRNQRVQSAAANAPVRSSIRDPYSSFVAILRKHATFSDRAFLLVLDTMEVVQWNPSAISRLADMLREFRAKGLVELRVVVSGRADVPELRLAAGVSTPADNIELHALSVEEATDMAQRLGLGAIGTAWDPAWSKAIAGEVPTTGWFETVRRALTTRDDVRREPLTVRVAVDLILQADAGDRPKLVEEIRSMKEDPQTSLAARLYERRIVSHVRDPKAKKLAWPGLVLRRVTPEIAHDLLASHCGLAQEDVDEAYEALAKEVWMVVREGNSLKHLPHLRARTLPLMRENDRKTFDRIAHAAVKYFAQYCKRSRDDRAEWIYHRLLAGEAIEEVAPEITSDIFQKLAGAENDFPQNSDVASYLASRTAASRLPPSRIRALAVNDALYHLRATSQTVFGLDDTVIDPNALEVSTFLHSAPREVGDDLYPWARSLWIKTGTWRRLPPQIPAGVSLDRPVWRAHLYWAARLAPSLPEEKRPELLQRCVQVITGELHAEDHPGLRSTIHAMAMARVCHSPLFAELDRRAAEILAGSKPNPMASVQAALRTAIVLGDVCRRQALELWLAGRRRGASVRVQDPTCAASELREIAQIHPDAAWLLTELDAAKTAPLRIADERTVTSVAQLIEELLSELSNTGGDGRVALGLARTFSHRDEDWIVPFGYAAERATLGGYSSAVRDRVARYSSSSFNSRSEPGQPVWSDMIGAMRIADEAGDLAGFARFILDQNPNSYDTGDLRALLECRDRWSDTIAGLLREHDVPPPPAADATEPPSGEPPAPGPILHKDDPQKDRWGGASQRDGRALRAVLESVEKDVFYCSLIVESNDGSPLDPPVIFHLHDTFARSVIHIRRIVDGVRAELSDVSAYGTFTVGVQVKTRIGTWTSLELDLVTVPGMPKRFLDR